MPLKLPGCSNAVQFPGVITCLKKVNMGICSKEQMKARRARHGARSKASGFFFTHVDNHVVNNPW